LTFLEKKVKEKNTTIRTFKPYIELIKGKQYKTDEMGRPNKLMEHGNG
jgi:hypothetical protein